VIGKECDELLADHAGRAKDAYGNSRHVVTALLQKKSRHGQTVSAGFSSNFVSGYWSSTTPPTRETRFLVVRFRVLKATIMIVIR
jgi:hypothetical protein